MQIPELDNNNLRAFAGLILFFLALVYIITNNENSAIEYILIALAGFLVGGAILSAKNKAK